MSISGTNIIASYYAWNTSTGTVVAGDKANHTLNLVMDGSKSSLTVGTSGANITDQGAGLYTISTSNATGGNTGTMGVIEGTSSTSNVILIGVAWNNSASDFTATMKTSAQTAAAAAIVAAEPITTDVGAASATIGLGATTFGGAGLVATFPIPLNLSITGATNPTAVNGLYVLENFYNGRPGYAGVDGAASYDYWYNGDSYIISIGAGNDSLTALFIGPTRNLVGQLSPQSPSTGVALVTPCTDATPNAATIVANQVSQGTAALATSAQASTILTNVAAIPVAVWNVLQSAIAAGATMGRWLLGLPTTSTVVITPIVAGYAGAPLIPGSYTAYLNATMAPMQINPTDANGNPITMVGPVKVRQYMKVDDNPANDVTLETGTATLNNGNQTATFQAPAAWNAIVQQVNYTWWDTGQSDLPLAVGTYRTIDGGPVSGL